MANPLQSEAQNIWTDKWRFDDAETNYHIIKSGGTISCQKQAIPQQKSTSSLVNEIAKARQHIQKSLKNDVTGSVDNILVSRVENLELENKDLRKVTEDLQAVVKKLESRISALEVAGGKAPPKEEKVVSKKAEKGESDDDDDDDFDLFGDDDEDEEAKEKLKEERIKTYNEKKSKKPVLIAKSNVILDVKPWGDDTDMKEMEKCVRSIEMDGLLWGTSKLQPVGYGIMKLTISTVVEDDKVSIEDLIEIIQEFDDHVQSVDVAAFNKL